MQHLSPTRQQLTAPAATQHRTASATDQRLQTAQLVRRCLAGDGLAWEQLVQEHQRRVYYLCYSFTRSAMEAEDLTQEVFLKLFCNLSSFDPERGSLHHWLQNITRNFLVDQFRRGKAARLTESLEEPVAGEENGPTRLDRLADSGPTQMEWMERLELKAKVQDALDKLPLNSREAVLFCDVQEYNYREAAEILQVPEGTVKSRLSRGRAELARLLGGRRPLRMFATLPAGRRSAMPMPTAQVA
ncbi:MAG: sigma-70 family RNA polymerase sigma factor [Acidobacteriota bacterium]|nr:sigma-70 family RNA polymerase sigma factor [Acidobacteriota bacterium]